MLDRKALQAFLREHERPLFSFLQRLVGDREVAASIFQDAFVAVARRGDARPTVLYRIAIERGREALRLHPRPPDGPEPPLSRHVRKVVGSLPQKLREVFLLRVYQQMSYGDIAEILETDETTVRARMEHALQHVGEPLQLLAGAEP